MKILLLILFSFISCSSNYANKKDKNIKKEVSKPSRVKVKQDKVVKSNLIPYIKSKAYVFDFTNLEDDNSINELAKTILIQGLNNLDKIIIIDEMQISNINELKSSDINQDQEQKILLNNDINAFFKAQIDKFIIEKEQSKKGLFKNEVVKIFISINLKIYETKNYNIIFDKTLIGKDNYSKNLVFRNIIEEENIVDNSFDIIFVKNLLKDMFDKVLTQINDSFTKLFWQGRIVNISMNKYYINSGRISNLKKGDILKVVDKPIPIFDPQTNNLIGLAPGRIKGTIQIQDYFGEDASIAIIKTGAGFKVGDIVELY